MNSDQKMKIMKMNDEFIFQVMTAELEELGKSMFVNEASGHPWPHVATRSCKSRCTPRVYSLIQICQDHKWHRCFLFVFPYCRIWPSGCERNHTSKLSKEGYFCQDLLVLFWDFFCF